MSRTSITGPSASQQSIKRHIYHLRCNKLSENIKVGTDRDYGIPFIGSSVLKYMSFVHLFLEVHQHMIT